MIGGLHEAEVESEELGHRSQGTLVTDLRLEERRWRLAGRGVGP